MIIHLNMRSYGGRSQHRNRAYARVFDTFRAGTADRFGIAGFTEIRVLVDGRCETFRGSHGGSSRD